MTTIIITIVLNTSNAKNMIRNPHITSKTLMASPCNAKNPPLKRSNDPTMSMSFVGRIGLAITMSTASISTNPMILCNKGYHHEKRKQEETMFRNPDDPVFCDILVHEDQK